MLREESVSKSQHKHIGVNTESIIIFLLCCLCWWEKGKRWNYWQGLRRKENVTLDLFHNHKNQASVQRAGMSFYCFDYLDPDYLLTFNLLLVCFLLSRPETELCDNTRPAGPELPVSPQCYVTGESGKQSRQVTSRVSGDNRSYHSVFQRGNYQIIKAISWADHPIWLCSLLTLYPYTFNILGF